MVLLLACVATEQPVDLLPLVRPTVGTGGLGFGYGGLSPAVRREGWKWLLGCFPARSVAD